MYKAWLWLTRLHRPSGRLARPCRHGSSLDLHNNSISKLPLSIYGWENCNDIKHPIANIVEDFDSEPRAHPMQQQFIDNCLSWRGQWPDLKLTDTGSIASAKTTEKEKVPNPYLDVVSWTRKRDVTHTHTHTLSKVTIGLDVTFLESLYTESQRPQWQCLWSTLVCFPERQEEPELSHGILYFRKYLVVTWIGKRSRGPFSFVLPRSLILSLREMAGVLREELRVPARRRAVTFSLLVHSSLGHHQPMGMLWAVLSARWWIKYSTIPPTSLNGKVTDLLITEWFREKAQIASGKQQLGGKSAICFSPTEPSPELGAAWVYSTLRSPPREMQNMSSKGLYHSGSKTNSREMHKSTKCSEEWVQVKSPHHVPMDARMMQDRLTDSTTITLLAELKPSVARYSSPGNITRGIQNTVRIPCS